jgi:hypothetical protein
VLGIEIAVDQNWEILSFNEAICIFVSIREDLFKAELDFTATVFTVVSDDRKSLVQEVQILGRHVHDILFH